MKQAPPACKSSSRAARGAAAPIRSDLAAAVVRMREPAPRASHESGHLVDERVADRGHPLERVREGQKGPQQQAVALLERPQLGGLDAGAAQADYVEAARARGVAVRDHERQAVLDDLRGAPDHRQPPDPTELVNADQPTEERPVADLDVAGQRHIVREDETVADAVVVGVTDETWGQRVVALVAVADGVTAPTLDEVRAYCRAHLAGYKAPRAVHAVAAIRRSAAGKPDYTWAAEVAAAR